MNTIVFRLWLIIGIFFSISCKKKSNNETHTITEHTGNVDSISVSLLNDANWDIDSFHVVSHLDTDVDIKYQLFSTPNIPVHDSVNAMVMHRLNWAFASFDVNIPIANENDVKKAAKSFEEKFQNENENALLGLPWILEFDAEISRPFKEIVCLRITESTYAGGAHGISSDFLFVFSSLSGRRLSLSDVFHDVNKLNQIAEKYFREQNIHEKNRSLPLGDYHFHFENNQFALNQNFLLTSEGLWVQYNPYEIGSYVIGAPSVRIPYDAIRSLLKISLTN
jgi:hypothetical protein